LVSFADTSVWFCGSGRKPDQQIISGKLSGISFEITDPVGLLFAGFECKKETVGMILADIFKTTFH